MTTPWNDYHNSLFTNEDLGLFLDLSCIDLNESQYKTIEPLFETAFSDMHKLEQGSISNPDENRQVGHYWLRNPDRAPSSIIKDQIKHAVQMIEAFSNDVLTC